MEIRRLRRLRGPNEYYPGPVAVAVLDLQELAGRETADLPGFTTRLLGLLPGLAEHHCSAGRPGGLLDKMGRGTYFGHVVEHVTLELSHLIGREVFFGRTVWAGTAGWFKVVLECPDDEWAGDPVLGQLLALAVRVVNETAAEATPDITSALPPIAALYEQSRLGVSAAELARAARRRDIPVRRPTDSGLLQLGDGCHRRLVWAASTEQTSAIGVDIASDKEVTKLLLAAAGIPVPEGIVVRSADEAVEAFDDLGGHVVVKPVSGHHGRDVYVTATAEEVISAYHRAAGGEAGAAVLVETYVTGRDYRILVVGGQVAAAALLTPPQVTGDGASDITALVGVVNSDPRRGVGHDRPLTRIALDEISVAHLARQGLSPDSVPERGRVVQLRHNGNLSTGGTCEDVTGILHLSVARLCARAAATVKLDVCGIDLRTPDISLPLLPGRETGGVIEVNSSPGLRMHSHPSEGAPRDVAAGIISLLYPPGAPSRVPLVSVTGTSGKTTTVRLIAHILRHTGLTVGMTCTDGVYIDGELIHAADASGPRSAEIVLGDPAVQAAVLETARGGIVRRGLGYGRADVAVVTNVSRDHVGNDGVRTLEDLVAVKSLVAEAVADGGQLVLNADDPHSAGMAARPAVQDRAPTIRYFSLTPDSPAVTEHLARGGTAYLLDDGSLVEVEGTRRTTFAAVTDVPQSLDGRAGFMTANVLAAAAAARALGAGLAQVGAALASFHPSTDNPGRTNVFHVGDVPVVLDYAHNPAALGAVGGFVREHWGTEGVAVLTLPGDRMDELVAESAGAVAREFDRVVVYEDDDLRGRDPGEMTKLISAALMAARPGIRWEPADGLEAAVTLGLALAGPSDPMLLIYEELEPVLAVLEHLGAHGSP